MEGIMQRRLIIIIATLFSQYAPGATYYVSPNGNDLNPGSLSSPFLTIKKGVSGLKPADILYLRAGVYTDIIDTNNFNFPSGTSWSNAINVFAYPGEKVAWRPVNIYSIINFARQTDQYIIFDGISFDAINSAETAISITQGAHHIRFQNCEIMNAYKSGVYILYGNNNGLPSNYHEFINCDIHNNGRYNYTGGPAQLPGFGAGHGLYITTQHNIFRGNKVHHNGNWGLHVYYGGYPAKPTGSNLMEGNRVYNNGQDITRYGHTCCGGIIHTSGDGNMAYNNIVYNNVIGILIDSTGSNSKVFNNTIYNNSLSIQAVTGGSGEIKNNISYPSGNSIATSGFTASNNLLTNPGFVNASAFDLRLVPTSPAIDKGISLSAITKDFAGTSRPQGLGYDIGAYEFLSGSSTPTKPAPPQNLKVQ
jgi:parallel beta-helix repeat protein